MIGIDKPEMTHAGACEVGDDRHAQAPAADNEHATCAQALLPGSSDFLQCYLARVVRTRRRGLARRMCMCRRGRRRTALAVHPAGVAVFVVLLLPDRQPVFDLIDDVATGAEGFIAMPGRNTDPY